MWAYGCFGLGLAGGVHIAGSDDDGDFIRPLLHS